MWARLIFGWVLIAAVIIVGLAGYFRWPWWVPVVSAAAGYAGREVASGFQIAHLAEQAGKSFVMRSMVMGALMFAVIWAIGFGFSFIF